MSLWHKCIHVPRPSPGGSTVSIPPQGVVLDFVGQRRPDVSGRGSDRDGWRNRMSEQRGRDFKVAPFGGLQIEHRRKRRPQTVVQLPPGRPGQAVVGMVISALPSMANSR